MQPLILLAGAYLLGAIPFGLLVSKLKGAPDPRSVGSGNIGATNVVRSAGWAAGLLTLALDIAKGYVAVTLTARLTASEDPLWPAAAALAVMLGHVFPVFLRFRGGKAVATAVGAYFALAPLPLTGSLVIFAATVAVSRYISLGSILAASSFPLFWWWYARPPAPVLAAAILSALLIVWRHAANIGRLRAGTESRLGSRGGGRP